MDDPSGSVGNRVNIPRLIRGKAKRNNSDQDLHNIFVRAHTRGRSDNARDRRWSPKWPRYCLIFDTETTLDPAQKLNLGAFRRCKLVGSKYRCLTEGIFYRDDVSESDLELLKTYRTNPPTL